MPVFFAGGTVTLSANGTGELKIRIPIDGTIVAFLVNNSGRCKISNMELSGYRDFFEGALEIDQLKVRGNKYELEEPIPCSKGQDFVVALEDISGSSNVVYFALVIRTG